MRIRSLFVILVLFASVSMAAQEQTGNIDIRSTLVGTRVYLDDAYVGDADLFLEEVLPGEHVITLRQGSQRIRGTFRIRPGELLMLEGRFEEDRIVDLKEVAREEALKRAEAEKKAEAERRALLETEKEKEKKKPQPPTKPAEEKKKPETKKAVVAAKPARTPEEERRDLHVNIFRADFEEAGGAGFEIKVTPKVNPKSVTNFTDSKSNSGKLFRNKQNILLCEGSGCVRDWTGRFFYIDDTGKRDAFLIRWKETVFSGITPAGTSKMEIDLCLNGDCKRISHTGDANAAVQGMVERYVLSMTKTAFIIRRSDLLKEINDTGGKVPEF